MDWFSHNWYDVGGAVVAIASILSNLIPKHTVAGKIVGFLALNLRDVFSQPKE